MTNIADVARLDEIEELSVEDEAEDIEDAPETKGKPKVQRPKIEFGATWLAKHVSEQIGREVDGKTVRIVLRSLTAKGLIEHSKGGRYEFTGSSDPKVALVVDTIRARGEAKAARAAAPKGRKAKDAAAVFDVVEDEDAPVEDLDELDA